jgi:tetratricopeptide (TPR) repeat protein
MAAMRIPFISPLLLVLCLRLAAQANITTELDDEARRANDLYRQSQPVAALPLYQDLHNQRPSNPLYTERLAMGYVAKAGADASSQAAIADRNIARLLFQQAQSQGDSSDLLQIMLEKLGAAESPKFTPISPDDPRAPGSAFAQAEQLFSKGDLKAAVALYSQCWQRFPNFYSAPLFAGDAEYKQGRFEQAGVWFARAITINPDLETAHRYWADALMKAGKPEQARDQYILALIADPFQKAPRLSLRAWAESQHERYLAPPITLPAFPPTGNNNRLGITMDPEPNETVERRSLAEKIDSIHQFLTSLPHQETGDDANLRNLMALDQDDMLECWLLLDAPGKSSTQDYVSYRANHRDLLRAYILKYDLHPA